MGGYRSNNDWQLFAFEWKKGKKSRRQHESCNLSAGAACSQTILQFLQLNMIKNHT
jgi:hypothetical protein